MVTLANRVKQTITAVASSGTGTLTLGAASDGYQTLADAAGVSSGDTVRYTIEGPSNAWELGSGVYTASGTTLTRNPTESSNSGNAITATTNSIVFITAAAADIVHASGNGNQHIPQDGAASQLLQYSSAGTAAWLTHDFVSWQSAWPADAGTDNIAFGENALSSVSSTGNYNVAVGKDSLSLNTTGDHNIAVGWEAAKNLNQPYNVAIGSQAMLNATNASVNNVAVGYRTLYNNNDGYNTAIGSQAMFDATSVDNSVAVGYRALYNSLTDGENVAVGHSSLYNNVGGNYNTALGFQAGYDCTTGDYNTFIGYGTANYSSVYFTGSNCSLLGRQANSFNNVSNRIYLGNASITSLHCNDTSISAASDERDKTNIVTSAYGLDFLNDVRVVTFTWNRRDGSMGTAKQLGFIAQEVYNVELKHSSTGYTKLVDWADPERLTLAPARMLPIAIKAIQELSTKIDALEARLAKLET
jgi:trimeric autotransporter adhesin